MKTARVEGDTKHITLDNDTYYKLVTLKGELKATTWSDLVDKIVKRLKESEKKKYPDVY